MNELHEAFRSSLLKRPLTRDDLNGYKLQTIAHFTFISSSDLYGVNDIEAIAIARLGLFPPGIATREDCQMLVQISTRITHSVRQELVLPVLDSRIVRSIQQARGES